jgi:hypothetical protein
MATALAPVPNSAPFIVMGEMSVEAVVERKRKIDDVMKCVMREGEHYGTIPGCGSKPTLFKAGAEVLATTFGLAPRFEIVQSDLPNDHREYRITCTLIHFATGANVGEGVGVCSTMESRYRWRHAERACPKCKKTAIIKGREEWGGGWVCHVKRGGCGEKYIDGTAEIESQKVGRVENKNPADEYNAVLKIAKKRAQVDCTLTAVGASDLLTQDLEDIGVNKDDVHVDYDDRSRTRKQSQQPRDEPPVFKAIDEASSQEKLDKLVPSLRKLRGAMLIEARKRWGARMQKLATEQEGQPA